MCMHSTDYAMSRCPSVTCWYSVETPKHITVFSPSDSQTILVFLYQTVWQYSDRDYLMGASNSRGMKSMIFDLYLALSWKCCKIEP